MRGKGNKNHRGKKIRNTRQKGNRVENIGSRSNISTRICSVHEVQRLLQSRIQQFITKEQLIFLSYFRR